MSTMLRCTDHAHRRQAQRNLSYQDVLFVFQNGQRFRSTGVLHVFLGRRDIPPDKATYQRFSQLEGTVLVLDDTRDEITLITAYRNRRASRKMKYKAKYGRKSCKHG
jgi:hypothetical protein